MLTGCPSTRIAWLPCVRRVQFFSPPLKVINAGKLIAQGYIPKNLASTIVRESDFKRGVSIMPLTTQGQTLWQNAWSKFKAG